ncbi:MAG: SPOR domain-containing protein [Timaviella obliquedivisa GSE-PSE-MK23-08B]|jgi:hypothetical protein|nr:SPOR domain-containing protein [Timaviella obliquedivisa GSE-PSE-MK23-08B]
MRPSSVEPFSPEPSTLHLMLQKALDNLDVQLEDELIRYRQQRYRQLGRMRGQNLAPALRNSPQASQAPLMPPLPNYAPDYATPQPMELDAWDEASSHSPLSNFSKFDARRVVREMRAAPQTSPGLPLAASIASQQPAPQQPELTHDYFASSEELLKSFSHPTAQSIDRKSTLLDTLLTPLGVGSMLLLLLSSISLGYVLLYPSSLGFLAALGRQDEKNSVITTPPSENQSLSPNLASDEFMDVNLNTLSQLPKNDRPSTVVTVPQTTAPTLSPTDSPRSTDPEPSPLTNAPRLSAAVTQQPLQTVTIPSRPVIRQSELPPEPQAPVQAAAPAYVPPAPQIATPAPQPAARRPAPAPAPPAAPAPPIAQAPPPVTRYYVVTEYTGDPSLSQARQAISDAYVRNFDDGAKVQMGSFGDSASAEQMAQQLQQQGVPAKVYQP